MYPTPNSSEDSRFLFEALPLVASYFSGEQVELAASNVGVGDDTDSESRLFAAQIRLRHALACCFELLPLLHRIESGLSTVNVAVRAETKGVIRGRLDIPRYVARRAASLSWPRTYPVLVAEESPNTPENALVGKVMNALLHRLSTSAAPPKSAEATAARWYRHWLSRKLGRDPWHRVSAGGNPNRLKMETARRVSRRQTGNERSYSELLQFVEDSRLFGSPIGGAMSSAKFARALLAFPADEAFSDRIFEIWCLREIAASFERLGAVAYQGPLPLTLNRRAPIYTFRLGWNQFDIWFQRALAGERAQWVYDESAAPLRGIPDITIVANNTHYLVVDAKNRRVTGNTRPEETYKVLGYFENFRFLLDGPSCWALLCFVSDDGFSQNLTSGNDRKVLLRSAHPTSAEECSFANQIDPAIGAWIRAATI